MKIEKGLAILTIYLWFICVIYLWTLNIAAGIIGTAITLLAMKAINDAVMWQYKYNNLKAARFISTLAELFNDDSKPKKKKKVKKK